MGKILVIQFRNQGIFKFRICNFICIYRTVFQGVAQGGHPPEAMKCPPRKNFDFVFSMVKKGNSSTLNATVS